MNQSNLYYRLKGLGSRIFSNNTSWLKKLDKDPTQLNQNPNEVQVNKKIGRREFVGNALKLICMPPIAATVISSSKLEAQEINHGQENINKSRSYEELLYKAENLRRRYKYSTLETKKVKYKKCFELYKQALEEAKKDQNEIKRGLKLIEVYKLQHDIYSELEQLNKSQEMIDTSIKLCEDIASRHFANFTEKPKENSEAKQYLDQLISFYLIKYEIIDSFSEDRDFKKEIKLLDRLIELTSKNNSKPETIAGYYHLRANCKFEIGDSCGSYSDASEALKLNPSDEKIKSQLDFIRKQISYKLATYGFGAIAIGLFLKLIHNINSEKTFTQEDYDAYEKLREEESFHIMAEIPQGEYSFDLNLEEVDKLLFKQKVREIINGKIEKDAKLSDLMLDLNVHANKKTLEEKIEDCINSVKEIESKKNLSDGDKVKLASLYQKILSLYEDIKKEKLKELIEEEDFEKAETIKGEYDAKITAYKKKLEPLKELLEGDLKIDFDQGLGEDD